MNIVDIALSQEGTREKKINEIKYNEWYYGRNVVGGEYPWCAVFVSWCAEQAGIPTTVIPKTASVTKLYDFFNKAGRFFKRGDGYMPQAGDIMIQKSRETSHVGIVYESDASGFYTIEGNVNNSVSKRSYSYDDRNLTGFGHPEYPKKRLMSARFLSGGISGSKSLPGVTSIIAKKNDSIQKIAEKVGVSKELLEFMNNTSGTLKVGQEIKVPSVIKNIVSSGGLLESSSAGDSEAITKKHTTGVFVSHPTIEIEFYCETGKLATVSTTGLTSDTDVDNDIISVNTSRDMSQDCPTFTVVLVWRNNWFEQLSSNDMLIIRMQRPPEEKRTVFYGLIDDIRKTIDFSSGKPQRSVQVTGRGFNKAFVNFDVGLISSIAMDNSKGFYTGLTQLAGNVTSFAAIEKMIEFYVGRAIRYKFADDTAYEDHFQYIGKPNPTEKLMDTTSYNSYNGSLWNFFKELGNSPFNETYWEIADEKPSMIHRRTPFNKEDWDALPVTVVPDCDLISDQTGRSDLETYTVFSVKQTKLGNDISNTIRPVWYPLFYEKYGISHLQVQTAYEPATGTVQGASNPFNIELFNFNCKNNVFENGNIVVSGKACYQVGDRLILEYNGMEYYVESVSHAFNCYNTWTTTLGVTRGIDPANRFTEPWGCGKDMQPKDMAAIMGLSAGSDKDIDWSNTPDYTWPPRTGGYGRGGYGWGNGTYTWPVPGVDCISSKYGPRDGGFHAGIDIADAVGTTIVAAYAGVVVAAGEAQGYGQWIVLSHGNVTGNGDEYTTYGHISVIEVSIGQQVSAGQEIAKMGNLGRSTGPHLHFQVDIGDYGGKSNSVDPMPYFQRVIQTGGTNGTASENQDFCYNYITQNLGLSKAIACGIMGNINDESGFKISSTGDGGTSYGLIQWHNERWDGLVNFCNQNGYPVDSLEGQLEWMWWEFNNTESDAWSTMSGVPNTSEGARTAGANMCIHYERPSDKYNKAIGRGQNAVNFYQMY